MGGGGEYLLYMVTMSDIVTVRQCDTSVDMLHCCCYFVPSFTCWEPVMWHCCINVGVLRHKVAAVGSCEWWQRLVVVTRWCGLVVLDGGGGEEKCFGSLQLIAK